MSARARLAQAYFDLATMLDAGLPIMRSFDVVVGGCRGQLKRVFSELRQAIAKGSTVAEAFEAHPRVFDELDRMLIQAAESSGTLNAALSMLSKWHEFVGRIVRRMLAGLIYPLAILHIGVFIAAVPGAVIGGFNLSTFLLDIVRTLMFFYVPALAIILAIFLRKRVAALRWPLDALVLRIPILGQAVYHMSVCRHAKAFGMMYAAGVPMTEATERATRATGNAAVASLFSGGTARVRAGGLAWEGFSRRLSQEYLSLWQIGEEAGELDKTVAKVAEIAGDRAEMLFTEVARWYPRIIYFIIMGYLAYRIITLFNSIYGNLEIPVY